MFHPEDTVVYSTNGICTIGEITEQSFCGEKREYYVLHPIYDTGATIFVPTDNEELTGKMRRVMTKEEINALLNDIADSEEDWIESDTERKKQFDSILAGGDRRKLMQMIRTLYLHGQQQKKRGKKLHIADERCFREAEKILYEEFAHVLQISTEEVIPYIREQLEV